MSKRVKLMIDNAKNKVGSPKVEQDTFVLTLMEVRKAKRANQKKNYKD